MIRLAAVGSASTGKSALLNALFGLRFPVDARAFSTAGVARARVRLHTGEDIEVIDTPPLEAVPDRVTADAFILVCDKDLVDVEYEEASRIAGLRRSLCVALNKADTYSPAQVRQILQHVRKRLNGLVAAQRVVACAADPVSVTHRHTADGELIVRHTASPPDLRILGPVVGELLEEAAGSLRVRARELTRKLRRLP